MPIRLGTTMQMILSTSVILTETLLGPELGPFASQGRSENPLRAQTDEPPSIDIALSQPRFAPRFAVGLTRHPCLPARPPSQENGLHFTAPYLDEPIYYINLYKSKIDSERP